jgi:hypothetical protein
MINDETNAYKPGDLVVGSKDPAKSIYSPTGAKLTLDGVSIYGSPEEIKAQSEELIKSAVRAGATVVSGNTLATKSRKASSRKSDYVKPNSIMASPLYDLQPLQDNSSQVQEEKLETIQFENDFGKIKAKVLYVIEQELAFMLVFKDEDSLVFEPKIGEMLTLHIPQKKQYNVYYPGVTFDYPNDAKKFMILFKVPNEE